MEAERPTFAAAVTASRGGAATNLGVTEQHDDATPTPDPFVNPSVDDHPHNTRELLRDAAVAAELATGYREKTELDVRQSLARRMVRLVGGWVLVLIGIAALPLPGPGWLIIIAGLSMLPYSWSRNLIRVIRHRIPGIPAEGQIPTKTWVVMGTGVTLSLGISIALAVMRSGG